MGLLTEGGTVLRDRIGHAIFSRVAGPDGQDSRARIHGTPGPRWFGPERPVRRVHGDASMFIGGLSALLLQSLHPLAMAAVAGHSGFRGDPWGRLQRTSTFLAVTTYGTADAAQRAVDRVRAVHETVRGTTADGEEYWADRSPGEGRQGGVGVRASWSGGVRHGSATLTQSSSSVTYGRWTTAEKG